LAETTDTTPAPETSDDEALFAKARAAMDEARPLNDEAEAKATDAVRYEITRNAKMLRALSIAVCKGALALTEPPRVCRRLFRLSHAAMAGCSVMA
jgi:hypothetical protein